LRTAGHQSPFRFRQLLGRLFEFSENHEHNSLGTAGHSFPIPDRIPTNRLSSAMSQRSAMRSAGHHFTSVSADFATGCLGCLRTTDRVSLRSGYQLGVLIENRSGQMESKTSGQSSASKFLENFPNRLFGMYLRTKVGGRRAQTSKHTHLIENRCENFRSSAVSHKGPVPTEFCFLFFGGGPGGSICRFVGN